MVNPLNYKAADREPRAAEKGKVRRNDIGRTGITLPEGTQRLLAARETS